MKRTPQRAFSLKQSRRRMTRQRRVILEVLQATTSHPDAYWVYEHVRGRLPRISLGTVYRTLGVFKDLGLALELNSETGFTRYDGRTDPHHHIHCVGCGRIADVELPEGNLEKGVVPEGYQVVGYEVAWRGICPVCQKIPKTKRKECPPGFAKTARSGSR